MCNNKKKKFKKEKKIEALRDNVVIGTGRLGTLRRQWQKVVI